MSGKHQVEKLKVTDKSYRTQENSVKATHDLREGFLVIRFLWVNKRLAVGEMQEQVWVIL